MNIQEIYDKVARHLLMQGERSISYKAGCCAYRGENGCKCSVGCLINDDAYSPALENHDCRDKDVIDALNKSGIPTNNSDVMSLLENLQNLHDNIKPFNWHKNLNFIADLFNLISLKD